MEGKVAVLGGADFVMPFSALGLDTYTVEFDSETVIRTAGEILRKQYALVVVAENVAMLATEVFEATQRKAVPCVVIVPFTTGGEGYATKALGRLLKTATGINILSN
ncbi:MAG: hypothetical protein IH624_02175 [Phycisphaerae bacterium]|nr:hypothetical protein [Phycisphaerae bacterium]